MRELGGSALFGARFRENAARSLLLPRAYPGKRTPLVAAAAEVAEPARGRQGLPALPGDPRDLPRVPARRPRPAGAHRPAARPASRKITLVEVETQSASPFASSLLFDYVATYMYEGDTPNAERRAAALALDRDLLSELLGADELRELIDPEALEDVERSLQLFHPDALAKDRDALQQVLRRLGDLTVAELRGAHRRGLLGRIDARQARARASRGAGANRRRGALDRGRGRGPLPRRARRAAARRPAREPTSSRSPTRW